MRKRRHCPILATGEETGSSTQLSVQSPYAFWKAPPTTPPGRASHSVQLPYAFWKARHLAVSLLHAGLTRGAMPAAAQPSPSFPPLHLHATGQFKAALPSVARAGLFSYFVHFVFLCGSVSHSSFMILFSPLTDWALSPNSKICFSSPHPPICHQTGSLLLSLSILLLQFSRFFLL